MYTSDTLKIGPVSTGDRAAIRALAEGLAVEAADDGDYLIVGPMSAGDRATVAGKALSLGLGCEDYISDPEEPQEPEAPAVDLSEVVALLKEIKAGQQEIKNCQQTTDKKVQDMLDKLTAAGAALQ